MTRGEDIRSLKSLSESSSKRFFWDRCWYEHECATLVPEIAAGVRQLVVDPDCSVEDLMRHIPGPDFPTAGFVVGREGIEKMYKEGRGRIVMRARVVKEALRGGKEQLVVTGCRMLRTRRR